MTTRAELIPGLIHKLSILPNDTETAHEVGNRGVHVVATLHMIGFIESCCGWLVYPYLEKGEVSVGTHVDVHHRAPIAPGKPLLVSARVTAIEHDQVTFETQITFGERVLMYGSHQRHIVSSTRMKSLIALANEEA